jgi:starvation-inducible outer membrane lipoprotein
VAAPQAFSDGQTIPQPSLSGCLAIPQELSKSAQFPTLSFSSFILILKYIYFAFYFS